MNRITIRPLRLKVSTRKKNVRMNVEKSLKLRMDQKKRKLNFDEGERLYG